MKKAFVSSFESFATLDGDGIRFQIFFQGCNLQCAVCHNPETQCILSDKQNCSVESSSQALEFSNTTQYSVEELLQMALRYKPYYKDNGGVTLSGGEPLLQADFLVLLCKKLKENNINITLDTSGSVLNSSVKELLNFVDLVLLDIKFSTEELYKKYAGGSLNKTLHFLNYLNEQNKSVWVRTVIIPNINDTEEEVARHISLIKNYGCVKKYELLAFHTLGFGKYEKLNKANPLKETLPLKEEVSKHLQNYADTLLKK